MCIELIIQFHAKADQLAAFLKVMEKTKEALPNVPGCKGVRVFQNTEDPNHFSLIETWQSHQLHDQYFEQLEKSQTWQYLISLLDRAPTTECFQEIGTS